MFNLKRVKNRFEWIVAWVNRPQKQLNSMISRLSVRQMMLAATLLLSANMLGIYGLNREQHQIYYEMIQIYEEKDWQQLNQLRSAITFVNGGEWECFLEGEAKQVLSDYQNNRLMYEEVRDQLVWIRSISSRPKRIGRYQNQVYQLKSSKEVFEEGLYYAKLQEWELAKLKLSEVIKEDLNYEKAQYWLKEIDRWEKDEESIESFKFYKNERFVVAY